MPKITKTQAHEIAKKLNEKRITEIKKLYNDLEKICTDLVISEIYKNHNLKMSDFTPNIKPFLNQTTTLYLNGCGFNHLCLNINKMPTNNSRHSFFVNLTEPTELTENIKTLSNKIKTLEKNYERLILETETAIYCLGTHKNIIENFSIAAPYLITPHQNKNTSLQINFTSLINKINE